VQLIAFFRRPVVRDLGAGLLLLAAGLPFAPEVIRDAAAREKMITIVGSDAAWQRLFAAWWLGIAASLAALAIARRRPMTAFLLAGAGALIHRANPAFPVPPTDLAAVIALYYLASLAPRRRTPAVALAVAVALLPAAAAVAMLAPLGWHPAAWLKVLWDWGIASFALTSAAVPALLLAIAYVAGDNARTRRLHHAALEQRAADLQRERDARAALAVAAERARISRELHDVLAHGLSVMVIQSQGAAAALHRQPERAEQAIASTIDTGRACLAEMRRLLGAIRSEPDGAPLAPLPGIGALPVLIDEARSAGTPVTLQVDGEARPVPSGVDLAAYRIVQESLTNTRKHAGVGASARVRLAFEPGHLEIEIADDGPGCVPRQRNDGNGLRGISERVAALGGTVDFTDLGGFGVRARLPVGEPG
jgi:signal transduction histidine kinase